MSSEEVEPSVFELLDRIQAIARTGLHFTDWEYDRERYDALLELATRAYGDAVGLLTAEVRARFDRELGYVTPKVGVAAAVFDEEERLLVVRRSDDGTWGLVGGWVEPDEHPSVALVREVQEEIGCDVEIGRLAVVHHRRADRGLGPHAVVSLLYLASITGTPGLSFEVDDAAFMDVDEIDPWHLDHEVKARKALAVHRGAEPDTVVDP